MIKSCFGLRFSHPRFSHPLCLCQTLLELCERPKEAEVENICVGRIRRLSDEPDDGCLLAVNLPAPGAEFVQMFQDFHVRSSTVQLTVHAIVPQQFKISSVRFRRISREKQ